MKMQLLELLVRIVVLVMVGFVLPALKRWLNTKVENEQMNKVRTWVKYAVYAAEQMYNRARQIDSDGGMRKKYVYNFVMRICADRGIKITEDELNALIEAAVLAMDTVPAEEV